LGPPPPASSIDVTAFFRSPIACFSPFQHPLIVETPSSWRSKCQKNFIWMPAPVCFHGIFGFGPGWGPIRTNPVFSSQSSVSPVLAYRPNCANVSSFPFPVRVPFFMPKWKAPQDSGFSNFWPGASHSVCYRARPSISAAPYERRYERCDP